MNELTTYRTVDLLYQLEEFNPDRMSDWLRWLELFRAAYEETGFGEFAPDFDNYVDLERKNRLVLFSARDDRRLVGYTAHAIWRHYNDRNLLLAQRRSQYVVPELRGLGIATKMLELTHEELKRRGVKITLLNSRLYRKQRLGYTRLETVWMKTL
jgi:GNAT superfamily N-acetyltransferase